MGTIFIFTAVILRIISNPLANVFQKQLAAHGNHPLLINFLTYFLLAILTIPIIAKTHWGALPVAFWIFAFLDGLTGALGNGLLIKALQKGDLSVLGPVNAYKSVVAIITGIFILGEIPGIWGIFGILMIILGSYFVLDTTEEKFSWRLFKNRAIQYRIGAMFLTAIEAVFIKKIIELTSAELSFASWCWTGAFFSLMLLPAYKIRLRHELPRLSNLALGKYALLVLSIGTMQITTVYAFKHMQVGYALSLFQLSIIASVLLGYRVFREEDIMKKLLGSVIMIIGSVIIIILGS